MSSEEDKLEPPKNGGFIAGSSLLSGLAAFIGASCCVLPLILVNIGVSTAIVGKLAFFARTQQYFLGAAVILLSTALMAAFWDKRKPSKGLVVTLVVAAVFIAAAYIMPFYEGHLLRLINL